jgi:hypothetical protein
VTSRKAEQLMVETWEMVMSKSYTNLSMLPRLVVILPKFVEFCVPLSMSIPSCVAFGVPTTGGPRRPLK